MKASFGIYLTNPLMALTIVFRRTIDERVYGPFSASVAFTKHILPTQTPEPQDLFRPELMHRE